MSNSTCNFEEFILIWLDATIHQDQNESSKRKNLLQTFVNYIRTFVDENECLQFIRSVRDESIFFIVSGSLGEVVTPLIHDLPQISQIYIFCTNVTKHNEWSKQFFKIRGVFDDENRLVTCLEKQIKIYSNTLIPFLVADPSEHSLRDIDEEQVGFLWFQLIIEVICVLPKTSKSKVQMMEECRQHYANNQAQLNLIDNFFNTYSPNAAISWYTRNCFLHRLLNKAFRTQNIDTIFNYHYFLHDLLKQLTSLYNDQFSKETGHFLVFRGQHMHASELDKLRKNRGHLVSVNTFFSTTKKLSTAARFCGNGELREMNIESIIFQIAIDLSAKRRPFAQIDYLSRIENEDEILFSMGSVFQIDNIVLSSDNDNIWVVELKLSNAVKKEVEDLMCHFKSHIGNQPSIVELGVLLSKVGDYERAKRFYQLLFNQLPETHHDIGVLHNNLGEIYRQQGYLDDAMKYFKQALNAMAESIGYLHPWFAVVQSNMALTYSARRQYNQALAHFRCALFILSWYATCE